MNARPPIWITGVGMATPLGFDYGTVSRKLLNGTAGIVAIDDPELSKLSSRIAGRIGPVPTPFGWNAADFARLDELYQAILWCCTGALRDADWWDRRHELRIGLVLGIGAEWMRFWDVDSQRGGNRAVQPRPDEEGIVHIARRQLELTGPASVVSAACASGNVALAHAQRWLRLGWVDLCLAGGCDLQLTPMTLSGFCNLRVVSRRNEDPAAASRPFDRDRDGFVPGEGGAVFLLEPADRARRRGARAYGELAGNGASCDASHLVIPSDNPEPAAAALRRCLTDAGLNSEDVDYLNAHGTATPVGDVCEARVIRTVFGEGTDRVAVSSTKSMTGHMLSGAAAMEALACLVALQNQAVPPTINLDAPDPECPLDHVPNEARLRKVDVAVSNSFGFGGSNCCVAFRKVA